LAGPKLSRGSVVLAVTGPRLPCVSRELPCWYLRGREFQKWTEYYENFEIKEIFATIDK